MPLYLGRTVLPLTGAVPTRDEFVWNQGRAFYASIKIASFMPTGTPRAIQALRALSAVGHKDVAFTC